MSDLRRRLDEHEIVLLGLLLTLSGRDLALVVEIGLVANEDDDDIVTTLRADVIDPFACLCERLGICKAKGQLSLVMCGRLVLLLIS